MVLEEVHQRRDTTFTSISQEESSDRRDASSMSCGSNWRDTSTSPRDALEELRQSHTSILNVTSDGEESDDEDASQCSYLFADLNEPPQLDDDFIPNCFHSKGIVTSGTVKRSDTNIITDWIDTSSNNIRNVTESFAESFCPGAMTDEHPCGSFERYVSPARSDRSLQFQMELDIFSMLGCADHTTEDELDSWTTPLVCPSYHLEEPVEVMRSRIQRIHKLRSSRRIEKCAPLKKNKSFDTSMLNETMTSTETSFHDAFSSFWGMEDEIMMGRSLAMHPSENFDGYDSDPGEGHTRQNGDAPLKEAFVSILDVSAVSESVEFGIDADDLVDAVQESLNLTWDLTWHPTCQNMETLGCCDKKKVCYDPISVQLWFERGQILHCGQTIIEPQFMWRQCATQRHEIVMPHRMRLLSVCRVLPVEKMDRSKYPLARTSHSFLVRMVTGDEFLFEAASESERDFILQRWKLVVARLATLAVFEDLVSMQDEFFSTDPTSILT
ncbi:hypothetical protein MHU86_17293 [Fragilaria crotonensis]|nr:hypothetical protein MHU86_17293 [Fragilaria crotonensis]